MSVLGNLGIKLPPTQFVDGFNRPDGPIGNGWIEAKNVQPDDFEPLGIYDGAIVCTDPHTRPGTYAEGNPPPEELDGDFYCGISCAWRDFGSTDIRASYTISGIWTLPHHVEGGPLVGVVPGTTEFGFGVWIISYFDAAIYTVGWVAAPPELWIPTAGVVVAHTEGTPRVIELRVEDGGVTSWLDGKQISFPNGGDPVGTAPFMLPEPHASSTLHGFCIDTHGTLDTELIPTTKVVHSVSFRT